MKLDNLRMEVYHIAAHLHDICKIGIKDHVLLKADKLNDLISRREDDTHQCLR